MQTLKERLKEDLKIAIKTSNSVKKDLLKVILSEIAAEEGRGKIGHFLNDEGVISILKKFKKNQEELIEKYKIDNRSEIEIESAKKELFILEFYFPQQMSEDEIKSEITSIIDEIGATSMKDMGKVMNSFNYKHAGKADGRLVSEIVKDKLNGNKGS
jgi:uncharacterized protein YqeY